jgi:hypothetical protein
MKTDFKDIRAHKHWSDRIVVQTHNHADLWIWDKAWSFIGSVIQQQGSQANLQIYHELNETNLFSAHGKEADVSHL